MRKVIWGFIQDYIKSIFVSLRPPPTSHDKKNPYENIDDTHKRMRSVRSHTDLKLFFSLQFFPLL